MLRAEVTNERIVLQSLDNVEKKVRKKLVRKGTVAAAKIVQKEVKRLAPRTNGFLQRSIKVVTSAKQGIVTSRIGQEKGRKFKRKKIGGSAMNKKGYAAPIYWIERGTKAHPIVPDNGKVLAITGKASKGKKAGITFTRKARHPGSKAQKILERAEHTKKAACKAAFAEEITKGLATGGTA